jgi:hypothetical protein
MARRRRITRALAACALLAGALAGCAGVPLHSRPQRIATIAAGVAHQPAVKPEPGDSGRDIVNKFLQANALDPSQHAAARQFLTAAASNRWSDNTATVLDEATVGTFVPDRPKVVVTGRIVGTLNGDGVYTPYPQGTGSGGARARFVYRLVRVHGEYRISEPSKGLLLTADQFQEAYRPRALYFFDLANRYLVPDIRWSALGGLALDDWLVKELAAGPSNDLQSAVNTDNLLTQAASEQKIITAGSPLRIEISGASQLDPGSRNRLAAQLGSTLNDAQPGELFTITDGHVPVRIPAAGSTQFSSASFDTDLAPRQPAPAVFYLRGGHIVDSRGVLLPGPINNGRLGYLTSLAVSRPAPTAQLNFAAVAGNRLLVGTQSGGFEATSVRGALSRPAFVPGLDEVWVADGAKLYRVTGTAATPGKAPRVQPVAVLSLGKDRKILAVRPSPEGSRVAMIISQPGGNPELYVAAVIRSGGQVRIDLPGAPISPDAVGVLDAAWIEPLELVAVGYLASSHEPLVFSTNVDGSAWSDSSIGNLPSQPDSVTVSTQQNVWVSANKTVWYQSGGEQWTSPGHTGQTSGYAPIYLQ